MLNFSTVLTNDRALGEDLVQDVLMRAHQQWGRIGDLDQPLAYVRRMLVNEFVSWRRKWARIVPRSDVTEFVESSGTVDPASGFAERLALAEDIARLPRKQRAVIILRYYEDLPDGEIADWLGCAPSPVAVMAGVAAALLVGCSTASRAVSPNASEHGQQVKGLAGGEVARHSTSRPAQTSKSSMPALVSLAISRSS